MEKTPPKCVEPKALRRTVQLENLANREGWRPMIHSPTGSKYVGYWHQNDKHGVGEYISRKDWMFSGYFDHNQPFKYGVSAFGKGRNMYDIQYRGEWKDGHFHGQGHLHFRNGSIFKGTFEYSKREGYGQMWYTNGSYYEGDWEHDLRHGMGFLVERSGNRYEGCFYKGRKHGRGVYFLLATGQYMNGIWDKDMCVSSIMADIPYRQTSCMPTEYTINEVKLDNEAGQVVDIVETTSFKVEDCTPCQNSPIINNDSSKAGMAVTINNTTSKLK